MKSYEWAALALIALMDVAMAMVLILRVAGLLDLPARPMTYNALAIVIIAASVVVGGVIFALNVRAVRQRLAAIEKWMQGKT